MVQTYNVVIVSSSVSLRVRPVEENRKENVVYPKLCFQKLNSLTSDIYEVHNLGLTRATIEDVYDRRDDVVRLSPDFVIFNIGAVDAPNREIPLWYSDVIFGRNKKFLFPTFNFLYNNLIKKYLRKILVKIRNYKPWVSPKKFEILCEKYLNYLVKETRAVIIVLDINKGNERLEQELNGSVDRYFQYSKILQKLSKKLNLVFVPVDDLTSEKHFPDGVHYNTFGHQKISDRIVNIILNIK